MIIIRGLIAIVFIMAGTYWFVKSSQGWFQSGFSVSIKEKAPLTSMMFSGAFIGYGFWDICNLVKKIKT